MEGTVTDLLGSKSSIQLRLFDDTTTEDDWNALAGVVRVSRTGTTWTFETSDKTMSERAILQRVLAQGLMIQSFHVGHPSLESLFLEVNA